ncbi:MAG TPA: polysaccharide biosynthesis tyrosine autokinase [Bacteroidia bacterium]|nr:polysaccharide biosynthesis tyrosine autokinase [Bacteroidia bacterium]HNT79276.1 polysaccharide biosynthesis tyrosine autokinase [Bacteroidia bacterium]
MNQFEDKKYVVKEDDIDVSSFLNHLRTKYYYFIISVFICVAAAVTYVKLTLPVFQAKASILIQDPKSTNKSIESMLTGEFLGTTNNLATEIGIINSNTVLEKTIDELQLKVSYFKTSSFPHKPVYKKAPFMVEFKEFHPEFYNVPFYLSIINRQQFSITLQMDGKLVTNYNYENNGTFGQWLSSPYFSIKLLYTDSLTFDPLDVDYKFIIHSTNKLVNDMMSRLSVEPLDKEANIATMKFKDNLPVRAKDVLNTIGKVYIDLDVEDKAREASLTLQFVDEQMSNVSQNLGNIEGNMQEFKEKNQTVNLSEEAKVYLNKLNTLDVERVKSDIELKGLNNLLSYIKNNIDMTQMAPTALGIPDPILIELLQKYQELQTKKKSLSYGVSENTPSLKILDSQIEEVKASLIENVNSIRQKFTIQNDLLRGQISSAESNIKQVPQKERELISIQRQFDVNQNIYVYLLQKKAETSIAKATVLSDNKVLDQAALVSDEPIEPNNKIILLAALVLAIIIPTILILIQSMLSTSIINKEDLSRLTDLPVLGMVNKLKSTDNLIVNHSPKSRTAEAFRSIRTNLQFYSSSGSTNRNILITSSISGEGKSFTSINLSTIYAMQGYRVCLMGLDLRKPKLYEDFNLTNEIGISNYLIGNATLDDIIQKTSIDRLHLISSGPIPPNPGELISKKEMDTLMSELQSRYDYVIIDTPPIGIVSDALVLMKYSHVNIYIVRSGITHKQSIKDLHHMAKENIVQNMGIILNGVDLRTAYGYGSYRYSANGAGYYDEDEIKPGLLKRIFTKA